MDRLTLGEADDILSRIVGKRALVVGDIMLDRYVSGIVQRVSPEGPVPVVRVRGRRAMLGGAANVAANLSALGASCRIVGHVGDDRAGQEVCLGLDALGVDRSGVVMGPERQTTVKTRIVARGRQIVRVDAEDDADVDTPLATRLIAQVEAALPVSDVLILQDYDKGVLAGEVVSVALAAAATAGVPVVVDPKQRHFFLYHGAEVFKPNLRELEEALGARARVDDPRWMEEARLRLGCDTLVVTLGGDGIASQCRHGGFLRVPAVAQSVFDVSGAGDTVTAILGGSIAGGVSTLDAVRLANHAAAVSVGKEGVAITGAAEIRSSLHTEQAPTERECTR